MTEKKQNNSNLVMIGSVVLILVLAFITVKYLNRKTAFNTYTMQVQEQKTQTSAQAAGEQAVIIAKTLVDVPATTPLYTDPVGLQKYIANLSKELDRDIVVIDQNKTILADTVASNRETQYTVDEINEVAETIRDGKTRTFTEKSVDYPRGIAQVVVPMKDTTGVIIGAVILSADKITDR